MQRPLGRRSCGWQTCLRVDAVVVAVGLLMPIWLNRMEVVRLELNHLTGWLGGEWRLKIGFASKINNCLDCGVHASARSRDAFSLRHFSFSFPFLASWLVRSFVTQDHLHVMWSLRHSGQQAFVHFWGLCFLIQTLHPFV
jgi:hypothetical protein